MSNFKEKYLNLRDGKDYACIYPVQSLTYEISIRSCIRNEACDPDRSSLTAWQIQFGEMLLWYVFMVNCFTTLMTN